MGKTYTGIDIGSHSIKLAVCDGAEVKTLVSEMVPVGLVAEGRITSFDAMSDFIKEACQQVPGLAKEVACVIPKANALTRRLHMPAMTRKELALNLPYEFRDYVSQGKDKFSYDYAVLGSQLDAEGRPESFDLLAVAMQKETLTDYTEMFKRINMKLQIALPEAAALQNLVGGNPAAAQNCCVLDLSSNGTHLHFFLNGTYDVLRQIELGCADIDRAIAAEYNIDEHIAAEYKHNNFEGALEKESVQNVFNMIAVEVGRALSFYGFSNPDTDIETVYYCGGGSQVKGLIEEISSHTGVVLRDIAEIMPPTAGDRALLTACPFAVGATME